MGTPYLACLQICINIFVIYKYLQLSVYDTVYYKNLEMLLYSGVAKERLLYGQQQRSARGVAGCSSRGQS